MIAPVSRKGRDLGKQTSKVGGRVFPVLGVGGTARHERPSIGTRRTLRLRLLIFLECPLSHLRADPLTGELELHMTMTAHIDIATVHPLRLSLTGRDLPRRSRSAPLAMDGIGETDAGINRLIARHSKRVYAVAPAVWQVKVGADFLYWIVVAMECHLLIVIALQISEDAVFCGEGQEEVLDVAHLRTDEIVLIEGIVENGMDSTWIVAGVALADIFPGVAADDSIGKLLRQNAFDVTLEEFVIEAEGTDMPVVEVIDADLLSL